MKKADVIKLSEELLDLGVIIGDNLLVTSKTLKTPLANRIFIGDLDGVKRLIEFGARVDGISAKGWTPLMIACFNGQYDIAKYLVSMGANIHYKDKWGDTALILAAEMARADIVELLKDNGAV